MSIKDILTVASEHVMETYDEDGRTRPDELAEVERELHTGFTSWTDDHSHRYKRIRPLPYRPDLFSDQRIDRPYRPVWRIARWLAAAERSDRPEVRVARPAIFLAELAYLKSVKELHAKTVGSKAVAETMIVSFLNTPATAESNSPSITEYVAEAIEHNRGSVGVTSGHFKELSDIGEITGALALSLAELYGLKYADKIDAVVNYNMTRQSYKVGKVRIPMPLLIASGFGAIWGVPPGESAEMHGIYQDESDPANAQFLKAWARRRKTGSKVIAFVTTGSAAVNIMNEQSGELERVFLKDTSHTLPLVAHCEAGLIIANKVDDQMALSPIVENVRPSGIRKADQARMVMDSVMEEHAIQGQEMLGVPIEYVKLYPEKRVVIETGPSRING